MENNDQKYIDVAIAEILNPVFAVTKQYLEVNEVEFENGLPRAERVDLDYSEDLVAVYFPIKGERYFLEVHLNKKPEISVNFVYTENGNRVYFTAVSDDLSFEELAQSIKLNPISGWSKGTLQKNGRSNYKFSRLSFETFKSEAHSIENQLNLLLAELEKDSEGIRQLSKKADAYISVCRHQYVSGNAGLHFDIETIRRLANLNLSVDIDTYIVGRPLKED